MPSDGIKTSREGTIVGIFIELAGTGNAIAYQKMLPRNTIAAKIAGIPKKNLISPGASLLIFNKNQGTITVLSQTGAFLFGHQLL
jgi:hypothetical protein